MAIMLIMVANGAASIPLKMRTVDTAREMASALCKQHDALTKNTMYLEKLSEEMPDDYMSLAKEIAHETRSSWLNTKKYIVENEKQFRKRILFVVYFMFLYIGVLVYFVKRKVEKYA